MLFPPSLSASLFLVFLFLFLFIFLAYLSLCLYHLLSTSVRTCLSIFSLYLPYLPPLSSFAKLSVSSCLSLSLSLSGPLYFCFVFLYQNDSLFWWLFVYVWLLVCFFPFPASSVSLLVFVFPYILSQTTCFSFFLFLLPWLSLFSDAWFCVSMAIFSRSFLFTCSYLFYVPACFFSSPVSVFTSKPFLNFFSRLLISFAFCHTCISYLLLTPSCHVCMLQQSHW